jgi:hypothetical protein
MLSLVLVLGLVGGVNPSEDSVEARAAAPLVQKETVLTQRWLLRLADNGSVDSSIITGVDARRVLAVPEIRAWLHAEAVRRFNRQLESAITAIERHDRPPSAARRAENRRR